MGAVIELSAGEAAAAEKIFGGQLPLAHRFVHHLATSGIERGLLGPREVSRLWGRHVLNCAVISELFPPGRSVADVGSGAGLPGVALAIARPDLRLTLIEPLERRVGWLNEVVADLDLSNVEVFRGRAEQAVGRIVVDLVTARAVTAMARLARLTIPLLGGAGTVIAIKGRSAQNEVDVAGPVIGKLGGRRVQVLTLDAGVLEDPTTVVRILVG